MSIIGRIHHRHHTRRRVRVLAERLAPLLPADASVLDVGCGDGLLDLLLQRMRHDVTMEGVDVVVRDDARCPVRQYDGRLLPYDADSFDAVLAVDTLHHADDPTTLLGEMTRVARRCVVLKDHTRDGLLAGPTLRFMDWVGNARFGLALPYRYWSSDEWRRAIEDLGWLAEVWTRRLNLYPGPLGWLFDRSLHFVARLRRA